MSPTGESYEDRVRKRAYELWEQAGEPGGRDDDFWHQAMREVPSNVSEETPQATAEPETMETPTQQPDALRGESSAKLSSV